MQLKCDPLDRARSRPAADRARRTPGAGLPGAADGPPIAIFLPVSPTVLRTRGYRFYFFSREERRPHVHVQHATGEAKLWLEPEIGVANNYGLTRQRLATALRLAREHHDEIRKAWDAHFGP